MSENNERTVPEVLNEIVRKNEGVATADIAKSSSGRNIFMGLGMASKGRLSDGLGVSSLAMLCLLAQSRRQLGGFAHVLVADIHSLSVLNDPEDKAKLPDIAADVVFWASTVLKQLGLSNDQFEVAIATGHSTFGFESNAPVYPKRELADIELAHKQLGCGVKGGWKARRSGVRDETTFDSQVKNKVTGMSFLYAPEGLSCKEWKGKQEFVPPYIGTEDLTIGRPIPVETLARQNRQLNNHLSMLGRTLARTLDLSRALSLDLLDQFLNDLTTLD